MTSTPIPRRLSPGLITHRLRGWQPPILTVNDASTGAQPFDGTPWEDNPVNAIAYFFGGKNAQGGSKISSNLNCGTLSSANACSDPTAFLCGTTDIPALDLLLTSFSNIHNFYNTMYESLDSVESDLSLLIEDVSLAWICATHPSKDW